MRSVPYVFLVGISAVLEARLPDAVDPIVAIFVSFLALHFMPGRYLVCTGIVMASSTVRRSDIGYGIVNSSNEKSQSRSGRCCNPEKIKTLKTDGRKSGKAASMYIYIRPLEERERLV